jgi:hypothetical protein
MFTRGQLRKWIFVGGRRAQSGQHTLGNGGSEDRLAVRDSRHGSQDLLLGCALEQVTTSARALALVTVMSSSLMVRTSTATSGATRLISAVALNPSVSGIARSMMITSGLLITAALIASRPVAASPTRSMLGYSANNARSPSRTTG